MNQLKFRDIFYTIFLLPFVYFLVLIILDKIVGIPKDITLYLITYIFSAILSSFYFKETGRYWWFGLYSPIIGGLVLAISIYILGYFYIGISGGFFGVN